MPIYAFIMRSLAMTSIPTRRTVRGNSKLPGGSPQSNGKVREDFELWNRIRDDEKLWRVVRIDVKLCQPVLNDANQPRAFGATLKLLDTMDSKQTCQNCIVRERVRDYLSL